MTTTPTPEQLRRLIETAQAVTEGISDPQLRGIAFGKVLDRLLDGESFGPIAVVGHPHSSPTSAPKISAPAGRVGPNAWIDALVAEGYFSKPRSLGEVTEAVRAQGHNVESKNVTAPLERLLQTKGLRRERKATETAKRGVWMYSTGHKISGPHTDHASLNLRR
jgi:hypothetical protein